MTISRHAPRALLIYPKFPVSFWTMPYLCRLKGCSYPVPPLGLLTVAALLPPSWRLRLVDENVRRLMENDWEQADIVLISAMITQWPTLQECIRQAKGRGKIVVVGGPLASSRPEQIMAAGADFVVRGEAENTLPAFLAAFESGCDQGVLETADKPDMSISPIPRYDLINIHDYSGLAVQTCRGCPFDCEFCDVVSLFGRKPRYKTPQQVVAELEALYRLGWRDEVFIVDDNFIGNREHAREILAHITSWQAGRGEPFGFWTQVSVNLAQDRDLIDRMTAANFSNVFIGVESPDPEVLQAIHKHHNAAHPLVQSLATIRDNGLTVVGSFIMGFDNEMPGVGERIAALVEAVALPNAVLHLLSPLPNTRLWNRLEQEGRLMEDHLWDNMQEVESMGLILYFRPTRPVGQIMDEFQRLWKHLYDRSNFMSRAYRYYLAMRPTRAAQAQAQALPAPSLPTPPEPASWGGILRDAWRFCRLAWRLGVKPPARLQFWTQLFSLWRRNPSRLIGYLKALAMGEEIFIIRESMDRQLAIFWKRERRHLPLGNSAESTAGP